MPGEKDLNTLLKTMRPALNPGDFVFCVLPSLHVIDLNEVLLLFKEAEGYTVIVSKERADSLQLEYSFVAAWITLSVHSALDAVGLTAAFSQALAAGGISCNAVAAFYHDHIFVGKKDAEKAMEILWQLAQLAA
ncbi:MAG TPA: ACT domain-containing protein [Haliscomenobacter sp.]|uniref:ACT domain-containing protein n=1 Tax=Haliscomenobacter sp. TaxID=2717303 RepID=UPI002C656C29|nr:ACT domain-containing protein [Haliscomenobacter sp.]HOY15763.1 ACT domain-containing protein [Haliscomenobacter sp.]HPH19395.1 ACT domain-containing protein [Haliscomenobacter sp.]